MKINKEKMIDMLIKKTNRSQEECRIICEIIEKHSIIGRKNKEIMKTDFMEKLNISEKESDTIYNISMELLLKEIF